MINAAPEREKFHSIVIAAIRIGLDFNQIFANNAFTEFFFFNLLKFVWKLSF